jgi:hypothetical protein
MGQAMRRGGRILLAVWLRPSLRAREGWQPVESSHHRLWGWSSKKVLLLLVFFEAKCTVQMHQPI